jgi:AcrR family transcriptional regulator
MPRITAPTLAEHRDQRSAAILQAGRDMLREGGPNAVTMAGVAARTGLSRPAIYEYYPSTAELLAAVLVHALESWTSALDQLMAHCVDPAQNIAIFVRESLTFFQDSDHRALTLMSQATLPPAVYAQVRDQHRSIRKHLIDALRALGVDDAEQAAQFIQGVVESAARLPKTANRDDADAVLQFVNAGIQSLMTSPEGRAHQGVDERDI